MSIDIVISFMMVADLTSSPSPPISLLSMSTTIYTCCELCAHEKYTPLTKDKNAVYDLF